MKLHIIKILIVSFALFFFGILGIFLLRKNLIMILMSIEIMLLAINFNFIIFSNFLDDLMGQYFALFVLTVAAAESSIGLALLVVYYRLTGLIDSNIFSQMKG